jgi:hypothetical protein
MPTINISVAPWWALWIPVTASVFLLGFLTRRRLPGVSALRAYVLVPTVTVLPAIVIGLIRRNGDLYVLWIIFGATTALNVVLIRRNNPMSAAVEAEKRFGKNSREARKYARRFSFEFLAVVAMIFILFAVFVR